MRLSKPSHWRWCVSMAALCLFTALQPPHATAATDTTTVGIYVTKVYDVNIAENSFKIECWIWFVTRSDSMLFAQNIDVVNAKDVQWAFAGREKQGNAYWEYAKCTATIIQPWEVDDFPFDKQKLLVRFEDTQRETDKLLFIPDTNQETFHRGVEIPNFDILNHSLGCGQSVYETDYGNPSGASRSSYPRVDLSILIARRPWGTFFKVFTGVFVAFVISMLVFFIRAINTDPRFGLSVGALFAAVANKYVADSLLPMSAGTTFIDKVHILTFAAILVTICVSVISLRLFEEGRTEKSKMLDRWAALIISISYVVALVAFMG